jgi:hypothetical protein
MELTFFDSVEKFQNLFLSNANRRLIRKVEKSEGIKVSDFFMWIDKTSRLVIGPTEILVGQEESEILRFLNPISGAQGGRP